MGERFKGYISALLCATTQMSMTLLLRNDNKSYLATWPIPEFIVGWSRILTRWPDYYSIYHCLIPFLYLPISRSKDGTDSSVQKKFIRITLDEATVYVIKSSENKTMWKYLLLNQTGRRSHKKMWQTPYDGTTDQEEYMNQGWVSKINYNGWHESYREKQPSVLTIPGPHISQDGTPPLK